MFFEQGGEFFSVSTGTKKWSHNDVPVRIRGDGRYSITCLVHKNER